MTHGEVFQLSVSNGGVPKHAITSGQVTRRGLKGDRQADLRAHGGPERALCLWSLEVIAKLCGEGHDLVPGAAGENVTVMGLEWERIVPGSRIRVGETVVLEITGYTTPCWKNARWFKDGDFSRMDHDLHPGDARLYARVIEEGPIAQGDRVELIEESSADRAWRLQPMTYRWPRDF
jgi:MOSC domain-containing protein YiiM